MKLRLRRLTAEEYAAKVLPLTHELWGAGLSFNRYVAQFSAVANSGYGKRSYKTFALCDDGLVMASFKRYERTARLEHLHLRAIGIGAVFTPAALRGRGSASAMLAAALDEARAEGFDVAYLFSDIHPSFYAALGFTELPSRSFSIRADTLADARIALQPLTDADWPSVRRCFERMNAPLSWQFERSAYVWNWLRLRQHLNAEKPAGQPVHLVHRRGKEIAAYAFGVRDVAHDAYVLDELGFAGEDARHVVPALLRRAAGDLRRIVGWLPPEPARDALPRGSVRRRAKAICMAAALSEHGAELIDRWSRTGRADGVWSTDHI